MLSHRIVPVSALLPPVQVSTIGASITHIDGKNKKLDFAVPSAAWRTKDSLTRPLSLLCCVDISLATCRVIKQTEDVMGYGEYGMHPFQHRAVQTLVMLWKQQITKLEQLSDSMLVSL
jgi:hypothetical protein